MPQAHVALPPAVVPTASESGHALAASEVPSLDELESRKRAIVEAALVRTKGKIYGPDGAAALLRMKPTTLASMVKRQNLARGVG